MTEEEAIKELKFAKLTDDYMLHEAADMAIKALEQEPCEDVISREEAIDALNQSINILEAIDRIKDLPPVISQPKIGQKQTIGHWIVGKYKDTCDKCRCTYPKNIGFKNYCPNCGVKMEVEE